MFKKIYIFYLRKTRPVFTNKKRKFREYEIGDWTYGEPRIIKYASSSKLKIGRFCSIAENVTILLGGEHRYRWVASYNFEEIFPGKVPDGVLSKGDVVIGNDVWIGRGATILSGVVIGNGAVIGACALVTKDVAPYSVVGGVPAKHLKYRFLEGQIKSLQEIEWWEWPIDRIKSAWPLLLSPKIDAFIESYK